jgi:hypothetical protein
MGCEGRIESCTWTREAPVSRVLLVVDSGEPSVWLVVGIEDIVDIAVVLGLDASVCIKLRELFRSRSVN